MTKKKASKKLTKAQVAKVSDLDSKIEDLDISDMTETQIEATVSAFSKEGLDLRRTRKKVRYQLYRLKAESEGTAKGLSTDEFKAIFEGQAGFEGWRMFAVTWDVAFDDPHRIVHKTISEVEEWDEVVKAKFPSVDANGRVSFPDINVRKKIEKEVESRGGKLPKEIILRKKK